MIPTTAPPTTVDTELSTGDLAYIQQLVQSEIAVQLEGKECLIESRLAPVARLHGMTGLRELVERTRTGCDSALQADVVEAMTTNETSFFRDRHPFTALRERIIPMVLAKGSGQETLTIWSAACSSGQESLSVAILVNEHFPELANRLQTTILSTDVSPAMVARCNEAIYSRFEINRGLPANYAMKYFDQSGRDWVAREELTDLIEARELNLIKPWSGLPKCDLVMLRNVLIYFSTETKADILRRIRTEVLKPDGCLLLGAGESTTGIDPGFDSERVNGATIFALKEGPDDGTQRTTTANGSSTCASPCRNCR